MNSGALINIGLCGLGTVGQGVWEHFTASRARLESRLGVRLEIVRVAVRDVGKRREAAIPAGLLTADALAVATDPAIPIVCELLGGTAAARTVTLAALERGRMVVTANKALLGEHGPEILAAARRGGGRLFFEASVAGGLPIIKALREGLVANRFPRIAGILNGTCNYILTRMAQERASYAEVLAGAKRLGYTEADEALDVEGADTAHKAAILTFLAHGRWVHPSEMIVEGISRITPEDLAHAATLGYAIKLLAQIDRDFATNQLAVRVHPVLVPCGHVLAGVSGVFNGVSVTGDIVGTTTYIGRGAGRDATASAVIADIADAVALLRSGGAAGRPREALNGNAEGGPVPPVEEPPGLAPRAAIRSGFYLRMTVRDEPGVLARVATVFARQRVSLASVIQRGAVQPCAASLVLTTHESDEAAMGATLAQLGRVSAVLDQPLLLRIGRFPE